MQSAPTVHADPLATSFWKDDALPTADAVIW